MLRSRNLRAIFAQEVDHAGNRTHVYHAQKRTIYPPIYSYGDYSLVSLVDRSSGSEHGMRGIDSRHDQDFLA